MDAKTATPETDLFPIGELSATEVALPLEISHLLPPYEQIPDDFKRGATWANRVFTKLYYAGASMIPLCARPGVDKPRAVRHIRALMGACELERLRKESTVAFLIHQWFEPPAGT